MLGAIALLALSAHRVTLRPGRPWSEREGSTARQLTSERPWIVALSFLFGGVYLAMIIAMIVRVLKGGGRSVGPRRQRRWYLIIIPLLLLTFRLRPRVPPKSPQTPAGDTPTTLLRDRAPTVTYDASRGLMIFAFVVGLALLLGAVWSIRTRSKEPTADLEDAIGANARAAADAIRLGHDTNETIVRCYGEMCDVLQREQGLERGTSMTPTEFHRLLATRGLPERSVRNLTELFEQIRYGTATTNETSQRLAIESLEAIAVASRNISGDILPRRRRDLEPDAAPIQ